MSERITKFQPDRTMYFRGFSGIDSPASMHSATATGFTVSGVFRDPAAFWVLVLFDVDDFYSHPRIKPLPDGNLKGIVLEFDVHFYGLAPLDTPQFPTIDFPFLDFIRTDGTTGSIDLSLGNIQTALLGANATRIANTNPTTVASGNHAAASVRIDLTVGGALAGDVLTLWFENFSYSYTMLGGDNPTFVAGQFASGINAYSYAGNALALSATSSGPTVIINAAYAGTAGLTKPAQPGAFGNLIRLYWVATDPTREFFTTSSPIQLSGGSSDVDFHVKLDFTELGIDQLRQAWLTFAPQLADSRAFTDTTADVVFSDWKITADPNNLAALQVAGPNSVRVEESDAWTIFKGNWNLTDVGWFSKGFARYSNTPGDTVTITYWSQFAHDLWLGTSVYSDRGKFGVSIDGTPQPDLNMILVTYPSGSTLGSASAISEAISTRRQIASGLAAGQHTVVLTVKSGDAPPPGIGQFGFCYFDFLEAVVESDVPDPPGPWLDRGPAIDYDTQHGYQLSPQRLLWMFAALGFAGKPIDEYIGVFWWNQRKIAGQALASATVDFSSVSPAVGDGLFLVFGATTIGKSVAAHETAAVWAAHFAYYINEVFAGVWASASGHVLTVTVRSSADAYQLAGFNAYLNSLVTPIQVIGSLTGSVAGTWLVDPAQTPALNYGAAKWHADLYAEAVSRGSSIVSAFSMEIVQPPDNPPTHVWVCRFPDGTAVETSTGFGVLNSSQCVPLAPDFLAYQKAAFLHVAQLQSAAGQKVQLQCGEFLWWFFQNGGPFAGPTGMAFHDATTNAAALAQFGRALYSFLTPNDDPSVNNFADANFLAARLNAHVAQIVAYVQSFYPTAEFEILFPNDVNGSTQTPISAVGGRLNAYISFPGAWQSHTTAPFQVFKLEQLAFETSDRSLDLVKAGLAFVRQLDWPVEKLRYLLPCDNPGCAFDKEYKLALAAGITTITPFAFDQINLLNERLEPEPKAIQAQVL